MNPPTNPAHPPGNDEPPIREFADRGTLWLLESPENLRGLLRLVAADLADRLDFSRATRINRSFVPDDLHKQEADLLYRVPFHEGGAPREVLVYVLLEHQSRPDRTMSLRLLSYMVQLWEAQRRAWQDAGTPVGQWRLHPIVPIVFYTGKRRWSAASLGLETLMELPPTLLTRFLPRHDTLFLSLRDTPPGALTGSAVAHALRTLQAADEPREALATILQEAVRYLEALPPSAQAEWRRAMRYLLLLIRHKRAPDERQALYQLVHDSVEHRHATEVNEMALTDAQVLMARGHREGRQEGQREVVRALLESRFGPLDAATSAMVDNLTPAQVNEVVRRFANAQTLADLGL